MALHNGNHLVGVYSNAMEAAGYKVFNDSVHGHISLHPLLVRVVDTPEFQRLRNIKQLGVAYYVFPGAGHCRYEHSLGTCYLAGQMVEKLMSRMSKETRSADEVTRLTLCVQLAALCHDLGHGPFSHTWEEVTRLWSDSENWRHEEASVKLFDYLVETNNLIDELKRYGLEKHERNIVKELIMGGPPNGRSPLLPPQDNFLYEIVSNKLTGIDVDKWDYFLRDGLHLNLRITFDYHRLLEFCMVLSVDDLTHIAFRDKEIMNLYDMFRVRSTLHHTAYRHRVVLNIELMVIDAFKAAGDAGYKVNNSDIALKNAHNNPESLSKLTDHVFYDILYSEDTALREAQALLGRILKRDLYKYVEKANVVVPQMKSKEYIKEKNYDLTSQLKKNCPHLEFRIAEFYIDLDSQNDPISRAKFYKKGAGSNKAVQQSYEEIKDFLEPFPFQLTKERTAQLLVFCKTQNITESDLVEAQRITKAFSSAV